MTDLLLLLVVWFGLKVYVADVARSYHAVGLVGEALAWTIHGGLSTKSLFYRGRVDLCGISYARRCALVEQSEEASDVTWL